MRIVSLNCWGGQLFEPLIDWIKVIDADVYCLQEVGRTSGHGQDWLQYKASDKVLKQRSNLFADLCDVLPDHQGFFSPTARGTLFDQSHQPVLYEFGLGTFVRNKFPIIGQTMDFVHGAFSAHGFGPYPRPQNAHAIRLYDYDKDRSICITHLHGLRDETGKGDTLAREGQAKSLVDVITRTRKGSEPLVVCGDLNLLPDSETFELLKAIGLTDLVTSRGFTDTRTSHYKKPGRFADYLLTTTEVNVARFDVVSEPEVSDHRALMIDIG